MDHDVEELEGARNVGDESGEHHLVRHAELPSEVAELTLVSLSPCRRRAHHTCPRLRTGEQHLSKGTNEDLVTLPLLELADDSHAGHVRRNAESAPHQPGGGGSVDIEHLEIDGRVHDAHPRGGNAEAEQVVAGGVRVCDVPGHEGSEPADERRIPLGTSLVHDQRYARPSGGQERPEVKSVVLVDETDVMPRDEATQRVGIRERDGDETEEDSNLPQVRGPNSGPPAR